MKSFLSKVGVILIGLAILGYAEAWGEDWKLYYSNKTTGQFYYDAGNIIDLSPDVKRVWVKNDVSVETIHAAIQDMGEGYRDLSYLLILFEINCKDKRIGDLKTDFYSKQGAIISSLRSSGDRHSILPDTGYEPLYKEVCK